MEFKKIIENVQMAPGSANEDTLKVVFGRRQQGMLSNDRPEIRDSQPGRKTKQIDEQKKDLDRHPSC